MRIKMHMTFDAAIASFTAAAARHAEASAAMEASERLFRRLRREYGDDEAYHMAGVNLADRRELAASRAERIATAALLESLAGAPTAQRLAGAGAVAWHWADQRGDREPANANRPKRSRRHAAQ
jgi:hypothetical protein